MCGIAGEVSFGSNSVSLAALQAMSQALAHRGPDDEGYFLLDSRSRAGLFSGSGSSRRIRRDVPPVEAAQGKAFKAGLVQRRFAIIDTSFRGHQPWYDPEAGIALSYNGEVYNYIELREELESAGYGPFRSQSDTEVIVKAYRRWGTGCFERFNGFWAMALVDQKKSRLVLSRDRFGIKPLYWFRQPGLIRFASEVRPLLQVWPSSLESPRVNPEALMLYLLYDRRNTLQSCLWQGVELFPKAHFAEIDLDSGVLSLNRFWELPDERQNGDALPLDQARECFGELLADAVSIRMRADVPVAINLSGGLDSSAIVALAQSTRDASSPVETYHIRYRHSPDMDESHYARAVARSTGCRYHELWIDAEEVWSQFDDLVRLHEEPVHSAAFFTQWLSWKAIRKRGIKVILHGAAGDEVLLGYSYLTQLHRISQINRLRLNDYLAGHSSWDLKTLGRIPYWFLQGRVWPSFSNPVRNRMGKPDRRRYALDYRPRVFRRWFTAPFLARTQQQNDAFQDYAVGINHSVTSRLWADVECFRVPYWVNAMDKSMMSLPVEVRMPFLDHRLVEFCFGLPIDYLLDRRGWTKFVMRSSLGDSLPREVVWRRRKMGFTVPKRRWLASQEKLIRNCLEENRSDLAPVVRIDDLISNLDQVPADLLWRIVNFAKWQQIFRPGMDLS